MSEGVTSASQVPRRAAIFGATSGIATALARHLAADGARLVLAARRRPALESLAADLRVRGAAEVTVLEAEFSRIEDLPKLACVAWESLGGLDLALLAYGTLPDQVAAENDALLTAAALQVNFVSPSALCGILAQRFEMQRDGCLAVITSVAGDRGRRSNYVYGAAKGGLQRFLEGLRHRLHGAGVQVLDVRPGFVSTPMTARRRRDGPLYADPDRVARDILRAVSTGRAVLYTPWFWRCAMAAVRGLPRPLFHRTRL